MTTPAERSAPLRPMTPPRTRLRAGLVVGFLVGLALVGLGALLLLGDLTRRPVVDVRRQPLVLHAGAPVAADRAPSLVWRQELAPLDGPVRTLRLHAADLSDLPVAHTAAEAPLVRARHMGAAGWSAWTTARDVRFELNAGVEGTLLAEFPFPLPAGCPLQLEVGSSQRVPGANGVLSPFLRYRGPTRQLTPPIDRRHVAARFERAVAASSDGLVPMTAVALAVSELDLAHGPLTLTLSRAPAPGAAVTDTNDEEIVARASITTGTIAFGGHLLIPLDRPVVLPRSTPLVMVLETPIPCALLGDADGIALIGLFGTPGPRPELGPLTLGALVEEGPVTAYTPAHTDLALQLTGPPSLARAVRTLLDTPGPGGMQRIGLALLALLGVTTLVGGVIGRICCSVDSADIGSATAVPAAAGRPRPRWFGLRDLAGAALVLALALGFRVFDLDAGAMSPDDGDFLRSARVEQLAPTTDLGVALQQDEAWLRWLALDFGLLDERQTYQHGYLHQLAIRWAWRLGGTIGVGRVTALRLDQALLGALTALLGFVWLRRLLPREPWVAWFGGALLAVQLVHVHNARTGWSQAGCTFFVLLAIALAARMRDLPNRAHGRLAWHALLVALATTLAYGFHEMAAVYVVALALIVLVEFSRDDLERRVWPWRSLRTWYGLAACVPVGTFTLLLLLTSEYARFTWFGHDTFGYAWGEARLLAIRYFGEVELARQLGYGVLVLAPIGFVGAVLRDARWARWAALWVVVPTAILFLRYNGPHLVRIYLPAAALLVLLAAEGFGVLFALLRNRAARRALAAAAIALVTFEAATTRATLFAPASAPLHVGGLHLAGGGIAEPRRPLAPLLEALGPPAEATPPGAEPIGVRTDRIDPLYRLLDTGYAAQLFDPRGPLETWPRRVIAPSQLMKKDGRDSEQGGPYRRIAVDRRGTVGLYVRDE
jgi:hypothetical protein